MIQVKNKIIERKNLKFFLYAFEFDKNLISEILGGLPIDQNDSLGVLLLIDICIEYKKGRNDLTDTLGANLTIGYYL